jgi:AcrR family transcriptional regulator
MSGSKLPALMARLKAAQRREQLIEVATRLFARSGYDATTTAAIAYAAGVTEPILYRHFKSKQELFVAIVRDVSRNTMIGWNQLIGTVTDPAEKIRRVCDAIPDHIKRYADHYHVLHGALSTSRDKKVIAVMKEHYREIEDFFGKIVAEGQKAGNFQKGLNPKAIAWHFITTGIGYAMVSLNLGQIDRPMVEAMIDSMLRGMRN